MTTGNTLGFEMALGLDYWAAATFFGHYGITVSTMAGLVRDGKDGPLQLYSWQKKFLRWLEPRLSKTHCASALTNDISRLEASYEMLVGKKP